MTLACSQDGLWCLARRDAELAMYSLDPGPPAGTTLGAAPPVAGAADAARADAAPLLVTPGARGELPAADAEVVFLGPPSMVLWAHRQGDTTRLALLSTTRLERVAELVLAGSWSIAAVTGARAALVSPDGRSVTLVRAASRSLVAQLVDPGGVVETIVGMDRNQLAVVTAKKLELWDAVAARPLQRLQFQLPPAPRVVGTVAGHWWVSRPGSEQLMLVRLSDGRPFLHALGASVLSVVSHSGSPWLVAVSSRGLLRLSCFAHALVAIEVPPASAYAIAPAGAAGEDASLLGAEDFAQPPWRLRLATPAPAPTVPRVSSRGLELMVSMAGEPTQVRADLASVRADLASVRSDLAQATQAASELPRPDVGAALVADGAEVADVRDEQELDREAPSPPHAVDTALDDADQLASTRDDPTAPVDREADGEDDDEGDDEEDDGDEDAWPERDVTAPRPRPLPSWAALPRAPAVERAQPRPPAPAAAPATGRPGGASPPAPPPDLAASPPRGPSLTPTEAELASAAMRLRAMRDLASAAERRATPGLPPPQLTAPMSAAVSAAATAGGPTPALPPSAVPVPAAVAATVAATARHSWRDALARYGTDPAGEPPAIAGELATLARRLELPESARRAAAILYGAWLAGAPFVPMVRLAAVLGEPGWSEALGTGELGRLGLLRHRAGAVAFRTCVLDALDGRPWAAIRMIGERIERGAPIQLRRDAGRIAVAAWPAWAARLGKVALVTGKLRRAIVEARLAELVAVTFEPITAYPSPWPAGAKLLVVSDALGGLGDQLPELTLPEP